MSSRKYHWSSPFERRYEEEREAGETVVDFVGDKRNRVDDDNVGCHAPVAAAVAAPVPAESLYEELLRYHQEQSDDDDGRSSSASTPRMNNTTQNVVSPSNSSDSSEDKKPPAKFSSSKASSSSSSLMTVHFSSPPRFREPFSSFRSSRDSVTSRYQQSPYNTLDKGMWNRSQGDTLDHFQYPMDGRDSHYCKKGGDRDYSLPDPKYSPERYHRKPNAHCVSPDFHDQQRIETNSFSCYSSSPFHRELQTTQDTFRNSQTEKWMDRPPQVSPPHRRDTMDTYWDHSGLSSDLELALRLEEEERRIARLKQQREEQESFELARKLQEEEEAAALRNRRPSILPQQQQQERLRSSLTNADVQEEEDQRRILEAIRMEQEKEQLEWALRESSLAPRSTLSSTPHSWQQLQKTVTQGQQQMGRGIETGQSFLVLCSGCNVRLQAPVESSLVYCPTCGYVNPRHQTATSPAPTY